MTRHRTQWIKHPARILLAACMFAGLAPFALAQVERQHGAHVHGEGAGTLAFDANQWSMSLNLPGFNVVGFEHQPNTDQQQQQLDSAMAWLEQGQWLEFDPRGQCSTETLEVTAQGYGEMGEQDHEHNHEHDHGHDHHQDHAHNHGETGHAYFEILVSGSCESVEKVSNWTMDVFDQFPNNELIRVAVLTETGAFEASLTPSNQRIDFD